MALKHRIKKEDFEKLPDVLKAEYKADGDDYILDVSGLEDTGALKRAKDREKQRADDAEAALKTATERLEALEGDDARKNKDINTLEKRWAKDKEEALKALRDELQPRVEKLTGYAKSNMIDLTAETISNRIAKSPSAAKLLKPHLKARLEADLDSDEMGTVILDAKGQRSKMTLDQLADEFVANKDFADIIKGTQASGGATKPSGGATTTNDSNKPADLSKLSARDLAAQIKERKASE